MVHAAKPGPRRMCRERKLFDSINKSRAVILAGKLFFLKFIFKFNWVSSNHSDFFTVLKKDQLMMHSTFTIVITAITIINNKRKNKIKNK